MTGAPAATRGTGPSAAAGTAAPKPTLVQSVRLALLDAGSTLVERVDLFMLELERAAHSAARIVALMVVAAVLGVTAWLGAWVLAATLLLAAGVPVIAVMAVVVVVNAGAAWFAWSRARALFGTLALPATRRQLRAASGAGRANEKAAGAGVGIEKAAASTAHAAAAGMGHAAPASTGHAAAATTGHAAASNNGQAPTVTGVTQAAPGARQASA
jgi:hypothetical protein